MTIRLRTLGTLAVLIDGTERPEMHARPVRLAVLLYLALERKVSRDRIMALLWPESDQDHARQALRQTLYALKQDLGDDWLESGHDTLEATPALAADATEVLEAMDAGRPDEVARLYTGGFLEGFHLAESQPFQLWCDQWRARLERANRRARRTLIDERCTAGDLTAALAEARRWLDLDPLEDEAQHRVIELLHRLGRGEEALREYEAYTSLLAREELEPLPDTRTLVEEIRSSSVSLPPLADGPVTPVAAGPATVRPEIVRRRALLRLVVPAGILLGVVAAVFLTARRNASGSALEPERILVLPLANETADSALDDIGLLAAEWISHGVAHTGSLKVVPSQEVLQMLEAGLDGEVAARERRAGTLVSGSFFRAGDSLELHVQVTDLAKGEVWHVLDPVRVSPEDPAAGLRELRDRVAGGLAVRFIPGSALPAPSVLDPPSYPAFQALMDAAAFVARGDWAGALPHLERAARLDTTFYRARLAVVAALNNLGEPARADSVLDALAPSRDRFSQYEQMVFQNGRAWLRGDLVGRLASVREAARVDPGGTLHYISAGVALAAGRPKEAVELYANLDPHCPWAPTILFPWADWTGAHHLLGDHRRELEEAGRARSRHPGRPHPLFLEVRALAGLGRLGVLRERLAELGTMAPEAGWDAGVVLYRSAAELRAHGHGEAAAEILASAIRWYQDRPTAERSSRSYRVGYADALLMAGRLDEAAPVLEGLRRENPEDPGILGREGVLAARLGQEYRLQEFVAALEAGRRPYQFGVIDFWLSTIMAWSGKEAEAFSFLRRSFEEGRARGTVLHADPFLEPLWFLPAFAMAVADED